jgi:hypothetical protein
MKALRLRDGYEVGTGLKLICEGTKERGERITIAKTTVVTAEMKDEEQKANGVFFKDAELKTSIHNKRAPVI